jgi:cell division GTPase FtsZ
MAKDPALDRIADVVRAISTSIPGQPGGTTDLTDLRIVLENAGVAVFGQGEATGPGRATLATEAAIADLRNHLSALRRTG